MFITQKPFFNHHPHDHHLHHHYHHSYHRHPVLSIVASMTVSIADDSMTLKLKLQKSIHLKIVLQIE